MKNNIQRALAMAQSIPQDMGNFQVVRELITELEKLNKEQVPA